MKREQVLVGLGALVLIAPWSGLPLAWLTWILLGIGIVVMGIGFTLLRRMRRDEGESQPPMQLQPDESRSSHIAFS
jgi:hypothetical protein